MNVKIITTLFIGILTAVSTGSAYISLQRDDAVVGQGANGAQNILWKLSGSSIFPSLASWGLTIPSLSSNGDCVVTDSNGVFSTDTCGAGGGAGLWEFYTATDVLTPITGSTSPFARVTVNSIHATSTATSSTFAGGLISNASSTFNGTTQFTATSTWGAGIHPIMHGIYAADSSGLHLHTSGGTEVAYFGAGGGANVTLPGYTDALLQTGATGAVSEYSGTTCTNQFVRALSALGIATCESVDIGNDTDLVAGTNITLTGSTLDVDDAFVLNTGDTMTGALTMSGANIVLDGNYLSGDGGNEGVSIDNFGRVGIGTNAPTSPLTISHNSQVSAGTVATSSGVSIWDTGNTNTWSTDATKPWGVVDYRVPNEVNAFTRSRLGTYMTNANGNTSNFSIYTGTGSAEPTERLTILSTGQIGIGTNLPAALFNVSTNDLSITPSTDADEVLIEGSGNTGISIFGGTDMTANIYFGEQAVGNGRSRIVHDGNGESLSFWTAGANQRMTILSNGNVGIGDATPASLLTVGNGDLFQVNSTGQLTTVSDIILSGSAANIRLGSNYLSGDGGDEGVYVASDGDVGIGNTASPGARLNVHNADGIDLLALSNGAQSQSFTNLTGATVNFHVAQFGGNTGASVTGLSDDATQTGLALRGFIGSSDPTDTVPAMILRSSKANGAGQQALGSLETILQVQNNSTPVLTALGSGNLGVGTTTPQSLLSIGTGYLQIDTTTAAPTATDCDAEAEAGRMKFDATNDLLYVCSGASGWVTK